MINDMNLQIALLDVFANDESKAFQWLFTPIPTLGNRTPIEMVHDGGINAVIDILEKKKDK